VVADSLSYRVTALALVAAGSAGCATVGVVEPSSIRKHCLRKVLTSQTTWCLGVVGAPGTPTGPPWLSPSDALMRELRWGTHIRSMGDPACSQVALERMVWVSEPLAGHMSLWVGGLPGIGSSVALGCTVHRRAGRTWPEIHYPTD
jgi:hypothetical protein